MPPLTFLFDECVHRSIGTYLGQRGHNVQHARQYVPKNTPDPVVAAAAERVPAIVVSWNHRDYAPFVRPDKNGKIGFPGLPGVLTFRCEEPQGVARLTIHIGVVEYLFTHETRAGEPLLIIISDVNLRIAR